ncbi:hypothetical protein Ancab_036534 [Ancistrocladus abbreviatus]
MLVPCTIGKTTDQYQAEYPIDVPNKLTPILKPTCQGREPTPSTAFIQLLNPEKGVNGSGLVFSQTGMKLANENTGPHPTKAAFVKNSYPKTTGHHTTRTLAYTILDKDVHASVNAISEVKIITTRVLKAIHSWHIYTN